MSDQDLRWVNAPTEAVARAAYLIWGAAIAEDYIVGTVSEYFARDEDRAEYLMANVFSRMQRERKVRILKDIIEQKGWGQDYENLFEQLKTLFNLRDRLAHSNSMEATIKDDRVIFRAAKMWDRTPSSSSIPLAMMDQHINFITDQIRPTFEGIRARLHAER